MTGEMAVGIVFVESSRSSGPKFSNSERNDICNEILAASTDTEAAAVVRAAE